MDKINSFFELLGAWRFWSRLFEGFCWFDWLLFLFCFVFIVVGLARGFGFFLPKLVRLIVLIFSTLLIGAWLASWVSGHLTFFKPGFWNPLFFLLILSLTFAGMQKLSKLRAAKKTPFFHPFWDRLLGALTGFFFAFLLMSFIAQFLVLLPSSSVKHLYGRGGARYGVLVKEFAPDFVNTILTPVRAVLNPRGGWR